MNFANWLQNQMVIFEITQKKLSQISGLHANAIHGWKTGRTNPNGYSLMILATAISRITNRPRPVILEEMCVAILKDQ